MDSAKETMNDLLKNPFVYAFSILFRIWIVFMFLYFFLVALSVMGDGFKALGGKDSGSLFTSINNPIAGLMVGVLATVLVQSSSTTTSVVVSAVGAGVLGVQQGVPIIMGANIGTSVTNTIVSLGFANDHVNYERAFAGATVHDMFNFLGVVVWLPIDQIINSANSDNGGLFASIAAEVFPESIDETDSDDLAIKKAVSDIADQIISTSSSVVRTYSLGTPKGFCERNPDLEVYEFKSSRACADPILPFKDFSLSLGLEDTSYLGDNPLSGKFDCACNESLGLNDTGFAEASGTQYVAYASAEGDCSGSIDFDYCSASDAYKEGDILMDFGYNLTQYRDRQELWAQHYFDNIRLVDGGDLFEAGYTDAEAGVIALIVGLFMIVLCLLGIVQTMRSILAGPAEKWVILALNYNFPGGGYLAILVGAAITVMVQSSSITTSILTPMVAIGTLELKNMFPFTIGANLGTTATGLIAGFADGNKNGVQIALCHFFFNLFNAALWYPFPPLRNVPIRAAEFLGSMAAAYRLFPVIYILIVFMLYPFVFLAISVLIDSDDGGEIAGGVIILLLFLISHGFFLYWYHAMEGKQKVRENIEKRKAMAINAKALAEGEKAVEPKADP